MALQNGLVGQRGNNAYTKKRINTSRSIQEERRTYFCQVLSEIATNARCKASALVDVSAVLHAVKLESKLRSIQNVKGRYFDIDHDELFNQFKTRHWINETDIEMRNDNILRSQSEPATEDLEWGVES